MGYLCGIGDWSPVSPCFDVPQLLTGRFCHALGLLPLIYLRKGAIVSADVHSEEDLKDVIEVNVQQYRLKVPAMSKAITTTGVQGFVSGL